MGKSAWDREYSRRGRLWGRAVSDMPILPAESRVLELGCGDGKTLSCMPDCWRKFALDVSIQALLLSQRICPDASLILADASALPFQDGGFDAVFAFHVTGHLLSDGREAIAGEVARVLAPGGRLLFREFVIRDMRAGHGEEVETGTFLNKNGIVTHFFQAGEAEELFVDLQPISVALRSWSMRIKGKEIARSELQAVFQKT